MKIIIARHAESTENAKTQDLGYDIMALLTENGILQAKKLGEYLKTEKIHIAYVSPQERAKHTAREVLAFQDAVEMIEAAHLRERNLGVHESTTKEVFKKARQDSGQPFHLFAPEQGESYAQVQARAVDFFQSLLDRHHDQTVLLVSHGGTTGMLLLHLFGKEITEENYQAHKPENTALTILEIHKDKPLVVHKLNSLEHLD